MKEYRGLQPGLLLKALVEHHIAPEKSWMIGDRLRDVQAALAAHINAIKLGIGQTTEDCAARKLGVTLCQDLLAAAHFILRS